MSWLARMILHKEDLERFQRSFQDNYALHKATWDCFPGRPDAARDFLLRLDWLADGCRLYVLCGHKPSRPDWCPAAAWGVKEIAPSFLQHDAYAFDLVANPTRKVHAFAADGSRTKNSKRLALVHEDEQRRWLAGKAQQHGFRLDEAAPLAIDEIGSHLFVRKAKTGTHFGVRFRGTLHVVDRERFIHAFHRGIGSAKAFGFGMLLLQPIS